MSNFESQLAELVEEEEARNKKKSTAELLLLFDEEIDRMFLEDSMVKPKDRVIHLRDYARGLELRVRDDEIKKKIWEGRARKAGSVEMLTPDMAIDAPEEVWAWQNIIMQSDTNLLVALPKVGKTTLIIDAIAKWFLKVSDEHLGQKFIGECPPVIIVGTDMPKSRWMPLLGRFGLACKDDNKKWHFVKDGPIKGLFTQNNPLHLDDSGLGRIADEVAKHKGCLLLCDSYAKLIQPFGLSEGDANFAGPLGDLQEAISPHDVTAVVIHHSGHSRKGEGAVAASRGSTALPAAVSQVINMRWLRRSEDANDKRVVLETEGRGEDLSIIVLQEQDRWSLEGDASEVIAQQRIKDEEEDLNDTQFLALELVRERSPMSTTANDLSDKHEIKARQARKTLEQLARKQLIERGKKDSVGAIHYNTKTGEGPLKPQASESPKPHSLGPSGPRGHSSGEAPTSDQLPIVEIKAHAAPSVKCTNYGSRTCSECGIDFSAKKKWQKFCSTKCRVRNHYHSNTVKK